MLAYPGRLPGGGAVCRGVLKNVYEEGKQRASRLGEQQPAA